MCLQNHRLKLDLISNILKMCFLSRQHQLQPISRETLWKDEAREGGSEGTIPWERARQ